MSDSLPFLDELWSLELTNFTWNLISVSGTQPPPSVSPNLLAVPGKNRLVVFGGNILIS